MSRRRSIIEVAFDVDDILAGAAWCIGTVTTQYVDEHLRSKIERRIATDTAWLNASARYLRLAGVTVARPNATPRTVTTVTTTPDGDVGGRVDTAEQLLDGNDEVVVPVAHGCTLRSGSSDRSTGALVSGEYVRLCDPDGRELLYWDQDEWRDDPALVMGAIINAAAGLRLTRGLR